MTTRNILRIDGVTPLAKKALQEEALKRYEKANASLLVRTLIYDELRKDVIFTEPKLDIESETVELNYDYQNQ